MANTTIVETNDIMRVLSAGEVLTLADGMQGLAVVLVLNPVTEKAYPDGEIAFPTQIRMGSNLYQIEPLPASAPAIATTEPAQAEASPEHGPDTQAVPIPNATEPAEVVLIPNATEPPPTMPLVAETSPEPAADTPVQELPVTPAEETPEEAPHTLSLGDDATTKEA